jgi:transposase-like protein
MELKEIYKKYPTKENCLVTIENVFWDNEPVCPYCNSKNQSQMKNENRYHCNTCKTTFSVMVNTVFHKSRVDLQKWFGLIWYYFKDTQNLPVREIASKIEVAKDTAWLMLKKVRQTNFAEKEKLKKIISVI